MTISRSVNFHLDRPETFRHDKAAADENDHHSDDSKEPSETTVILSWNINVHAKEAGDNIERDDDRGQDRDLCQRFVRVIALQNIVNVELSKVIGMGTRQHLLHMAQIRHHRDNVVLDIA